jgi:uncharacterized membrane protein
MKNKTIIIILLILSIIGLFASAYLTVLHFIPTDSFCDLNATFSCSKINQSKYSSFLGIPVALLGLCGYLIFIIINLSLLFVKSLEKYKKQLSRLQLTLSVLALIFSLYLTYIEFAVLWTLCILCLTSQIVLFMLVFFSYVYYNRLK